MAETSLIVCNDGYDEFLPELFDSLKNQTNQDFDIVYVDFGGNLQSKNILNNYNFDYQAHTIESNVQEARTFGSKKAKGRFICVMEVDATYDPQWLEIMSNELRGEPDPIAFTYCNFYFMRGKRKLKCHAKEYDREDVKGWQTPILLKRKYRVDWDSKYAKLQDWKFWLDVKKIKGGEGKKVDRFLWTHIQPNRKDLKSISWRRIGEHRKWKRKLKKEFPNLLK